MTVCYKFLTVLLAPVWLVIVILLLLGEIAENLLTFLTRVLHFDDWVY